MTAFIGRRDFITLLGGAATWPMAARAQQPQRRPQSASAGSKFRARGIRLVSCRHSERVCVRLAWSKGATTCLKNDTPMATRLGCRVFRRAARHRR